ncbi:MAG: hypothetical protein LBO06_01245 [Bacteroidales bacterium]|jgi:hypothetical protein|nr:hypothetical protein [Bacteroidales bacterium]
MRRARFNWAVARRSMSKAVCSVVIALAIISLTSCATSMTPTEVYKTLPELTKSNFLTATQAESSNCKCLTKGRKYSAPMGRTVKGDLRRGAKGIDEWVILDGGNAYVLTSYQWVAAGFNPQDGSKATQLHIEFDTYLCE